MLIDCAGWIVFVDDNAWGKEVVSGVHRVRYSQLWESDWTGCFFKYMYRREEINA
jgi:hypothetical protein